MTLENGGSLDAASAASEGRIGDALEEPTIAKPRTNPAILLRALAALLPPGVIILEQGRPRPPLKVGFRQDIIDLGLLTPLEASIAFRYYTAARTYLLASTEGAERIGVDGKPAGTVTAEEAQWAAVKLAPQPAATRISLAGLRAVARARKAAITGAVQ